MITPRATLARYPGLPVPSSRNTLPPAPADLLRRARLLDFLHSHIRGKLILVCAAAGYGKTSLLLDFAHETDLPVAWCSLLEAHRDLPVLVADLASAIRRRFPEFRGWTADLASQPAITPQALAADFAQEAAAALNDYLVLILEDFHFLDASPQAIGFFDALLAELPEQLHLVISGRTIPPLRLAPLAARGQVDGLGEEQLRFRPDEVQALLQLRNQVSLPLEEAEKLVASTEGWITGILLSTHLMWQGMMASLRRARRSESPLYQYLADEVLNQQPPQLKQFLLEAAVLPEMDPGVCNAVFDRDDCADLLGEAQARRLFVSVVGDEQPAYQYHHLFREFLLSRLETEDPERLRALQLQAGKWYEASGMPEAAVTFYAQGGQLVRAAQVAQAHAPALFSAGRHATLRRWGEQLRRAEDQIPRLFLYLAKSDTDSGDLEKAELELRKAEAGYAGQGDQVGQLDADIQRTLLLYRRGEHREALSLACQAAARAETLSRPVPQALALRYGAISRVALGELEEAENDLRHAERLLRASAQAYDRALVLDDLAGVLRLRGRTAEVARIQQESLALWRQLGAPGPLAVALNNTAWDLHMLGQYPGALATYEEALQSARRAGSVRLESTILTGWGDVQSDLGRYEEAAHNYLRARTLAEQAGEQATSAYVCRSLAVLERRKNNPVAAMEWLNRAALATTARQAEAPLGNLDAVRGIVLFELGHASDGLALLEKACQELSRLGADVDLALALFHRARVEYCTGVWEAAAQSLGEALAVAERVGYDQMLVSEAPFARGLLGDPGLEPGIAGRAASLLLRGQAALASGEDRIELARQPIGGQPPPRTLEVRALGSPSVILQGVEISCTEWPAPRVIEFFFYIVDSAPVSREKLAELFWPDRSPARAGANLNHVLYRLRRTFGQEVVVLAGDEVRLSSDLSLKYDVADLVSLSQKALGIGSVGLRRLGALAAALELYRGDFLEGTYAEWALARRSSMSNLYVQLLVAYADELMKLTRYSEAREALAKALTVEPLQDDLHERMLLSLAGMGRRHEVVAHYQRYRETLRTELGLDPPPETRALYSRLLG